LIVLLYIDTIYYNQYDIIYIIGNIILISIYIIGNIFRILAYFYEKIFCMYIEVAAFLWKF